MKDILEIIDAARLPKDIIADLQLKSITVPGWAVLEKEYNPKKHPVFTDPGYLDKVTKGGIVKVSRIALDLQRLAVKRMAGLTFGTPVKRTYAPTTDGEKEVAKVMEKIMQRTRIDSVNNERSKMLFAGCEVVTLWYAIKEKNNKYGIPSEIKLKCKNYSPMNSDTLYPLFDEYDDLIALSFGYSRVEADKTINYFDTYTKDQHIRWTSQDNGWVETAREMITLGKIPAVYITRPTPIWEDTSDNVYEIEWTISRNGNYIRKNSKPIVGVFADDEIQTRQAGDEKSNEDRDVYQYPKGSDVKYITWAQATEALKFQIQTLKQEYFTSLQLPDISYESMKTSPMSGEARKLLFIDAHLKVKDESGRWIEALDREVNIVKEFMKAMMPGKEVDIDSLQVECTITPYAITEEKDTIQNLSTATGGKPIISQVEAVKYLGWSDDVDKTMAELNKEALIDISQPTV